MATDINKLLKQGAALAKVANIAPVKKDRLAMIDAANAKLRAASRPNVAAASRTQAAIAEVEEVRAPKSLPSANPKDPYAGRAITDPTTKGEIDFWQPKHAAPSKVKTYRGKRAQTMAKGTPPRRATLGEHGPAPAKRVKANPRGVQYTGEQIAKVEEATRARQVAAPTTDVRTPKELAQISAENRTRPGGRSPGIAGSTPLDKREGAGRVFVRDRYVRAGSDAKLRHLGPAPAPAAQVAPTPQAPAVQQAQRQRQRTNPAAVAEAQAAQPSAQTRGANLVQQATARRRSAQTPTTPPRVRPGVRVDAQIGRVQSASGAGVGGRGPAFRMARTPAAPLTGVSNPIATPTPAPTATARTQRAPRQRAATPPAATPVATTPAPQPTAAPARPARKTAARTARPAQPRAAAPRATSRPAAPAAARPAAPVARPVQPMGVARFYGGGVAVGMGIGMGQGLVYEYARARERKR